MELFERTSHYSHFRSRAIVHQPLGAHLVDIQFNRPLIFKDHAQSPTALAVQLFHTSCPRPLQKKNIPPCNFIKFIILQDMLWIVLQV